MKEKGQKLKICAKKARAANKRRVAFLAKIATRWIYFIHIFRQLLVPNLSKSEQKNSVLALGAYYTDYNGCSPNHVLSRHCGRACFTSQGRVRRARATASARALDRAITGGTRKIFVSRPLRPRRV